MGAVLWYIMDSLTLSLSIASAEHVNLNNGSKNNTVLYAPHMFVHTKHETRKHAHTCGFQQARIVERRERTRDATISIFHTQNMFTSSITQHTRSALVANRQRHETSPH